MSPSRVRQVWQTGKPAWCTAVALSDPVVCEIVASLGYDCIWLDLEHHPLGVERAAEMMRAVRAGAASGGGETGCDVMARPGKGEFMRMGRLLEAGAHGILYPRCDDAAEAREVVRWAKFAPLGERGFDGGNADNAYGSYPPAGYTDAANRETWLALQVESPAAVPETCSIAEVEGVDLIFFGPGDFSLLDGRPGDVRGDRTRAARAQVARDTLAAGKRFGTLCFDADDVREALDQGATLIAMGADVPLLRRGFERQLDEMRSMLHDFPEDDTHASA